MSNVFTIMSGFWYLMLQGFLMSLTIWFCASLLALCIGFVVGILNAEELSNKLIKGLLQTYVFVMRGIPLYIQLLLVYFVLPEFIAIPISPFFASILALGLCSSAYVAQIITGGLKAIPLGQWQACDLLGYSYFQKLRYVIVPQLFALTFLALGNELEATIKSTAIMSVIGLTELTKAGTTIVARTMEPAAVYLILAIIYLIISGSLRFILNKTKKRFVYVGN